MGLLREDRKDTDCFPELGKNWTETSGHYVGVFKKLYLKSAYEYVSCVAGYALIWPSWQPIWKKLLSYRVSALELKVCGLLQT